MEFLEAINAAELAINFLKRLESTKEVLEAAARAEGAIPALEKRVTKLRDELQTLEGEKYELAAQSALEKADFADELAAKRDFALVAFVADQAKRKEALDKLQAEYDSKLAEFQKTEQDILDRLSELSAKADAEEKRLQKAQKALEDLKAKF